MRRVVSAAIVVLSGALLVLGLAVPAWAPAVIVLFAGGLLVFGLAVAWQFVAGLRMED